MQPIEVEISRFLVDIKINFLFQEEKAAQVIQRIRGPDYSVRAELKELVANASSNTTDNYSFKDVLKAVAKREFLAPFFSLLFLVTVQGKIKPNIEKWGSKHINLIECLLF